MGSRAARVEMRVCGLVTEHHCWLLCGARVAAVRETLEGAVCDAPLSPAALPSGRLLQGVRSVHTKSLAGPPIAQCQVRSTAH